MSKPTFNCKICGTEYSACPDCDRTRSWLSVVDTPECWQIYISVIQNRDGIISDKEAITDLASVGVTPDTLDETKLKSTVRERISALFSRNATKKKSKHIQTLDLPVEDEESITQDFEQPTE